jgi:hypothetical protein
MKFFLQKMILNFPYMLTSWNILRNLMDHSLIFLLTILLSEYSIYENFYIMITLRAHIRQKDRLHTKFYWREFARWFVA